MSHLSKSILLIAAFALGAPRACAQEDHGARLEDYLVDHALQDFLAEHYVERLEDARGAERSEIAQKLGKLYVGLLDTATDEDERQYWSEKARNLLRVVPESDSPDLRINLAKAAYIRAEQSAERVRLRIASDEEAAQTERILRDTASTFLGIAQDANQRVNLLERKLGERMEQEEEARVTQELADARQQRSLGFYYAGWSEYYLSLVSGDPSRAGRALRHFGWLLGGRDGDEAAFSKLQDGMLQYGHVARAAVGAALASAELGRFAESVAWLDAIETSPEAPDEIREQIFDRRIWVYAQAGMWADLELMVRRRRTSGQPLEPITARLLVVGAMDALGGANDQGRSRELIRQLADTGLRDLVTRGEVAHVLELVREFGTGAISESGFIPLYVRGLLALDEAKIARTNLGDERDGPVEDPGLAARYREAGDMLMRAADEPDAEPHPDERVRAITTAGSAYYIAGDAVRAADVLERAIGLARDPEQAEDALWLAVVALEDAVESGRTSLTPRRDQAAQLFLTTYPGSERAAQLLMRPGLSALVPPEEAVEILLSIPSSSGQYLSARRQAASLLYRLYRSAPQSQKAFIGERFLDVASQLIRLEQGEVRSGDVDRAKRAAERLVLEARQIADVALSMRPPDTERAALALETVQRVTRYASIDTSKLDEELLYRRLQIAAAENNAQLTGELYDQLAAYEGGFLTSAQRLLYRQSVERWLDEPENTESARDVVRYGQAVIDQLRGSGNASRALLGVLETVAQAAAVAYQLERDEAMLDVAIRTNNRLIESSGATGEVLKRQAGLLESAGRPSEALEIWRRLVTGLDTGSEAWFEARYESIRILNTVDRAAAVEALTQHVLLYPELGPDPWHDRFAELAQRLGVEVNG